MVLNGKHVVADNIGRRRLLGLAGLLVAPGWTGAASTSPRRRVLHVGPGRAIKRIGDAARLARDGDAVEVDAGDYLGDTSVWLQDDLMLRAVGGRVRLLARGAAAEGKGIWVVRGGRVFARGFDFYGAAVAAGNGAGIRFDSGALMLDDCAFIGNEMGLLTGNDPAATLEIDHSEFAWNFRYGRHNHNLYVGTIARVSLRGSYLHHARTGHLLKSRAAISDIRYNRLTDEDSGQASYEAEFPNGGRVTLLGNVIAQSAETQNQALIAFGAEGYRWPSNTLDLVHNTLLDHAHGAPGTCLALWPGASRLHASGNLLVGRAPFFAGALAAEPGNVMLDWPEFQRASDDQFRLRHPIEPLPESVALRAPPMPEREYVHPRHSRPWLGAAHNAGALQRLAPTSPAPR